VEAEERGDRASGCQAPTKRAPATEARAPCFLPRRHVMVLSRSLDAGSSLSLLYTASMIFQLRPFIKYD
jgi:hypothetical protein